MTEPDPVLHPSGFSNLAIRVMSAIVLAPLAIAAAWYGGWVFAAFWLAAAVAVFWEWSVVAAGASLRLMVLVGASGIVAAAIVHELSRPVAAALVIALAALASAVFAPNERRLWVVGGALYAGVLLLAPLYLRADPQFGFSAVVLIFAVVWATDVFAYFGGRAFGGPKLAPAISPKKTWSGAVCGTFGALAAAFLWARFSPHGGEVALAVIAVILSVVSQLGDLGESAFKRHFHIKDSSHLIPGHGGVMDRLDGFWAAVLLACAIGLARGGFETPGRGLLLW